MNPQNINVSRRLVLHDEDRPTIIFTAGEYGKAMTYIHESEERLHIDDIRVEPDIRGNGIGGLLLHNIKYMADNNGFETVTARIVSRECVDAMVSTFGKDAVTVVSPGTYATDAMPPKDRKSTIASLRYKPPR